MNVYEILSPGTTVAHVFVAANSLAEALSADPTATSARMLGELIFITGGEETAKALTGGRQVALDEAKASITDSHLVSFEDGRSYKSLMRHLKAHGLTFDQYKAKWGLPEQYPSVHPSYTIMRRDMALAAGLGRGKKGKDAKK
jgi:predicted transcriptional regulator